MDLYAKKAKAVVVRHRSGHQVIAMVEIVSQGNKASQTELHAFVSKADQAMQAGVHLLIVDLFPPTARDPHGIHRAIWGEDREGSFALPEDKPLTCVSYVGQPALEVFLEPVAVGDGLPDMPLFLSPEIYVPVPLETTYVSAWEAVPDVWREVILSGAQGEPEDRARRERPDPPSVNRPAMIPRLRGIDCSFRTCAVEDFEGIARRFGVGAKREEDQRDGPGDQHVVGEVEDGAVEADGVDVEVDEVADVAEDEAVVAVAQRAGHDQAQGDRQGQAGRGASDEEPVADGHARRRWTGRRRSGCCRAGSGRSPRGRRD